jgi:hypothetical protein
VARQPRSHYGGRKVLRLRRRVEGGQRRVGRARRSGDRGSGFGPHRQALRLSLTSALDEARPPQPYFSPKTATRRTAQPQFAAEVGMLVPFRLRRPRQKRPMLFQTHQKSMEVTQSTKTPSLAVPNQEEDLVSGTEKR